MKITITTILLILFFGSSFADNSQIVYLFGKRSDIKFLNAEGDLIYPLMYEFKQVRFYTVDIDSADNEATYAKLISKCKKLPAICICDSCFFAGNVNLDDLRKAVKESIGESKTVAGKVRGNSLIKSDGRKGAGGGSEVVFANVLASIVMAICFGAVYFARKRYLQK